MGHWQARAGDGVRRAVGAALILLTVVPFYRLAAWEQAGLAGRSVAATVAAQSAFLWSGAFVIVLLAFLAGVAAPRGAWERPFGVAGAWLLKPSARAYALGLALAGLAVTLAFTALSMDGKPNLIDAMAQLVQARYWAAGQLAGPRLDLPEFWFIQNTVLTPEGWVSQYPPGHVALLAAGMAVGAVELVGALAVAVAAALTYLSLRRLLPGREIEARLAGLFVAVGPFFVAQAGSFMNHGTAVAFSVVAVYAALRTRDGAAWGAVGWALLLGVALGMLLTIRPLHAVVMGFGVILPIAVSAVRAAALDGRSAAARAGATIAAGVPFVVLLFLYNARFFGGPTDFGYTAAWGEGHGLGFHRDPWGNVYNLRMALAYTSADLTALGLSLLETPLPLVTLVGLWLLLARKLEAGEGILVAWAVTPVLASAIYWHHTYFMGPRMLTDAAAPWSALVALVLVWLPRAAPDAVSLGGSRLHPRTAVRTGLVLAALAAAFLIPLRQAQRGGDFLPSLRIEPPRTTGPSLVFVHGAWSGRQFARLAAGGRTLTAIETILRQNDNCAVQRYLDTGAAPMGGLDLDPRPVTPGLVEVDVFPGNTVVVGAGSLRRGEGLRMDPPCMAEIEADRNGIVDVAPFVWQGDLPGLEPRGAMYVRDMGPESNRRLLAAYPDRRPWVFARNGHGAPPALLPYDEAMAWLWGEDRALAARSPGGSGQASSSSR